MTSNEDLIEYTSTTLPAGSASTDIDLGTIKTIHAFRVVSGPADAFIQAGGASWVPVAAADPGRDNLRLSSMRGKSAAGGALVLEIHGV